LEAQGSSHLSQDVAFGPILRPKAQYVCESELKVAVPHSKGASHNFGKCVQSFCRTPRELTKYVMKHRGKFGQKSFISQALKHWLPREAVKEVAKRSCLKDENQR